MIETIFDSRFPGCKLTTVDSRARRVERTSALDNLTEWQARDFMRAHCGDLEPGLALMRETAWSFQVVRIGSP